MQQGEFELIKDLRSRFRPKNRKILGIGDDCAVVEGDWLLTTDALTDGIHFQSKVISFEDLGYKSIAVNISDVAAMGGYPVYALVTIGIPEKMKDSDVRHLADGIEAARDEFAFEVIGGDTVKSKTLFLSVTVVGRPFVKPLLRSVAKDRDFIYVTGTLGDSRVGLDVLLHRSQERPLDQDYFLKRHFRPSPRVHFMEYVSRHITIHACMDVSDGLLGDLSHIADESGVGFFIETDELPLSRKDFGLSNDSELDYLVQCALNGGEDYELLFTSPDVLDLSKIEKKTGVKVSRIGRILAEDRLVQYLGEKRIASELLESYRHF